MSRGQAWALLWLVGLLVALEGAVLVPDLIGPRLRVGRQAVLADADGQFTTVILLTEKEQGRTGITGGAREDYWAVEPGSRVLIVGRNAGRLDVIVLDGPQRGARGRADAADLIPLSSP